MHTVTHLPTRRLNVQDNEQLLQTASGTLECCACDWDDVRQTGQLPAALSAGFDLILASDCLYYEEKYARSLVAVLALLLPREQEPGSRMTTALLSQSYRGAPDVERIFFEEAAREGLHWSLLSQAIRPSTEPSDCSRAVGVGVP